MSQTRKQQAIEFAKEHGFDGVIPIGYGCFRKGDIPEGVPNGCDWFEAGVYNDWSGHFEGDACWHPLFDSTLHVIVVDDGGARWIVDGME